MLGWQIFTHSVRLVWANRGVALKVSAVLYIISAVFQIWSQGMVGGAATGAAGSGPMALLVAALQLIIGLWIAVAWHRYILLEEIPQGFVPQWHGARMAAYFGRSLLIALIVIGVFVASGLPLIVGISPAVAGPLFVLGAIFAVFVFYRLCAILPATAMGTPITMKEAWSATEGITGTIMILILCMFGSAMVMILPAIPLAAVTPMLGLFALLVAEWFITMFGISILTTFYGYFIEKRELS